MIGPIRDYAKARKKHLLLLTVNMSIPCRDVLPGSNSSKRRKLLNVKLNLVTPVVQQMSAITSNSQSTDGSSADKRASTC